MSKISKEFKEYVNALVEEIVLQGMPFGNKKKYLKKYADAEGIDFNKVEKGIEDLLILIQKGNNAKIDKLAESIYLTQDTIAKLKPSTETKGEPIRSKPKAGGGSITNKLPKAIGSNLRNDFPEIKPDEVEIQTSERKVIEESEKSVTLKKNIPKTKPTESVIFKNFDFENLGNNMIKLSWTVNHGKNIILHVGSLKYEVNYSDSKTIKLHKTVTAHLSANDKNGKIQKSTKIKLWYKNEDKLETSKVDSLIDNNDELSWVGVIFFGVCLFILIKACS